MVGIREGACDRQFGPWPMKVKLCFAFSFLSFAQKWSFGDENEALLHSRMSKTFAGIAFGNSSIRVGFANDLSGGIFFVRKFA